MRLNEGGEEERKERYKERKVGLYEESCKKERKKSKTCHHCFGFSIVLCVAECKIYGVTCTSCVPPLFEFEQNPLTESVSGLVS